MTDLTAYASSLDAIEAALKAADYTLVHGNLSSLPAPHYLIPHDLTLESLVLATGTVVVIGSLVVTGVVDFQQHGKPLVNLIVTGDCTLDLAYVDAFICVGKTLTFATLIADSNWGGGVFVGGDLRGHTLVSKDIGIEVDGTEHVERVADCEDEDTARRVLPSLFVDDAPQPRTLFVSLRDSLPPSDRGTDQGPIAPSHEPAKPRAKQPATRAVAKAAKGATRSARAVAKAAKGATASAKGGARSTTAVAKSAKGGARSAKAVAKSAKVTKSAKATVTSTPKRRATSSKATGNSAKAASAGKGAASSAKQGTARKPVAMGTAKKPAAIGTAKKPAAMGTAKKPAAIGTAKKPAAPAKRR